MAMPDFACQLVQFGPEAASPPRLFTLPEARHYCQRLARSHYENFTVVSWLLPARLRPPMYALYAYCRWADDLADEVSSTAESIKLLAWWRDELLQTYEAAQTLVSPLETHLESGVVRGSQHPVMIALEETLREYSLPLTPLTDLISAFEQDQRQNRYETWMDLSDYCRRSANPVGHLILGLAGCDTPENRGYSDDICTGLQLTNFWQDVASDLERGRIYLPREAWRASGYTESDFAEHSHSNSFRSMLAEGVERAERHFRSGIPLLDRVPRWLRTDLSLFVRGGMAILNRIRTIDYDVWTRRPTLDKREKISLLLKSAILGAHWGLPPPLPRDMTTDFREDREDRMALEFKKPFSGEDRENHGL